MWKQVPLVNLGERGGQVLQSCWFKQGSQSTHPPRSTALHLNTLPSHNLVMKHLPGADPELVLLGHHHEELEVRPEEAGREAGREDRWDTLKSSLFPISESHSAT